jgi:hypothetical protein
MQADVERLLARLLTDSGLRERFIADPARVAIDAGLSPEEAEGVARMPVPDVRTAARGYEHKRNAKQKVVRGNLLTSWIWARRR